MVDKVLLEHETPFFDDVKQGSFHSTTIHPHPSQENMDRLQALNLLIDFLIAAVQHQQLKKVKNEAKHTFIFLITH